MLRKWALAQSFGLLLLIVPGDSILADGAEGVAQIGQRGEVVHVTSIQAYGTTGEENAFHFLPLLVLLPAHRVGRLELALIELECKTTRRIGFAPGLCGGIEPVLDGHSWPPTHTEEVPEELVVGTWL